MFKDELVEDPLHTGLPVTLKGRVHIWSRKTWLIGINQNCYIGASLMMLKSTLLTFIIFFQEPCHSVFSELKHCALRQRQVCRQRQNICTQ